MVYHVRQEEKAMAKKSQQRAQNCATSHLERLGRGSASTSIAVRHVLLVLAIVAIGAMTSGCEAIGAIFKAGVWVGVIGVIAVIALVAFVAMKVGRS
jgi:hypothetical protein